MGLWLDLLFFARPPIVEIWNSGIHCQGYFFCWKQAGPWNAVAAWGLESMGLWSLEGSWITELGSNGALCCFMFYIHACLSLLCGL